MNYSEFQDGNEPPGESTSSRKSLLKTSWDFIKNNKDYFIAPSLGFFSLPLAGLYLSRKKSLEPILFSGLVGAFLSVALNASIVSYQTRDINELSTKEFHGNNIKISHSYDYSPANSNPEITTLNSIKTIAMAATNNYIFITSPGNPPEHKITNIFVEGRDHPDEFLCKYELNGFMGSSEIDLSKQIPKQVDLEGAVLLGRGARGFYGGFCRQTYNDHISRTNVPD